MDKREMLIVDWTPITETEEVPPLGEELISHLSSYKGVARFASCSAWNLLYRLLISIDKQPYHVLFTKAGKPYLRNSDIYFSISHSKDVCAVAVADYPVGIDVEVIKNNYTPHLLERTLTKNEWEEFDGDFTRIWCRKEALVKMTGDGIKSYPFNVDTSGYSFDERKVHYKESEYWIVSTHI